MNSNNYKKDFFSIVVKESINLSDVTRNLGLKNYCGNRDTVKKYIKKYNLDTNHFHNNYNLRNKSKPKSNLVDILKENSTYDKKSLKQRLYKEGIKKPICELCGQNEIWNGEKMSLILDHINGINDDNRIVNLRIVCPNCNATLPTHGAKNIKNNKYIYKPLLREDDYCECGNKKDRKSKKCISCYNKVDRYKVKNRPPYEQLIKEINDLGYKGVGRKYDVSDTSIRKWKNKYEKDIQKY